MLARGCGCVTLPSAPVSVISFPLRSTIKDTLSGLGLLVSELAPS